MKKTLAFAAAAVVSASLFASCDGAMGSASPKSEMDSVSFAIGIDIANQVKAMDSEITADMVAAGIKAGFAESGMTPEDANAFLMDYFSVRKPAKNKKASEDFLANIEKTNANVKKTESGLLYEILEEGTDVFATNDADVVSVMYEGKTKEGKVFDSSVERGDTIDFPLNRVISGWGEGMKLVGKGGKIKLYIPSELAYGEQGQPYAGIAGNEALVFEVQLIDVKPAEEAAE